MSAALDLVRAHYLASERGDLDGMLAVLAPDATWTEAAGSAYAGTYIGAVQVRERVFARIDADWSSFEVSVAEFVADGGMVVALGRYTATGRATGRTVTARFAHVWHIEDNTVSSFEQIADTAALMP